MPTAAARAVASRWRAGRSRRRASLAAVVGPVLVAAALAAGACAGPGSATSTGATAPPPAPAAPGSTPASGGPAATTRTTVAPSPPEQFGGALEDFYVVPSPLPPGEPGTLIRTMPVKSDAASTTLRVMYHSRDAQDRDRAVTGIITYPNAAAPADGWPVVSWAHGTSGLTSICAPSRGGGAAPAFGIDGVRVATDYIGLGPVGERHPYLSGASEAHSVIDAVRAARLLPAAHAGTRWAAIGHSQGGHSALFTNELGQAYAPELELVGTIVVAPAAVLGRTFGPADQIVPRMVGIMALYGWAADYPQVVPDDYVGDDVRARAAVIDQKCLDDVVLSFVTIPVETFYKKRPDLTEPAASVIKANDPGHVAVASPLLLVSGSGDTFVVPDRVHALDEQLCGIGQTTELVDLDGADHGTEMAKGAAVYTAWLQDRFAGRPAKSTCTAR